MDTKRRDHRNRVLRPRESQNLDGRYRYTYYENGRQKTLYSWKLEPTDKMPVGKRPDKSLREKVAELQRQQMLYGSYTGGDYTVIDLAERYIAQRQGVRETTRGGYQTVLNVLKREEFGKRKIRDIRISDAKMWLIQMQRNGRGFSSIHNIRSVLRPAFKMAVDDDIIIKNPFDFELRDVIENDSKKREAVTESQREKFLEFIRTDSYYKKYYEAIFILFHTGLRISEFCGLTLKDVDMNERVIHVGHQLQKLPGGVYIISQTKTKSGSRDLPMSSEVYDAFMSLLGKRKLKKKETMVDGYVGFLYLDKAGNPKVAHHWQKIIHQIVDKYNKIHEEKMPKITPHICRHTYCTSMARAGVNPKTLQYLMGHAEIATTMDVYTHLGYEDAKREVEKVEVKLVRMNK